jgi:hypothetical protein
MSADEVSGLREDIAVLRTIVEERGRIASANGSMLRTIGAAIIIQIFVTVYFAGVKTQALDRLQQDVINLQSKFDSK